METLLYMRGTLCFFLFSFIKKMAIYAGYPIYSWSHNFDQKWQFMPVTLSIVGNTLVYARYHFFSFFSLKKCIPNITKSIKFLCFLIDLMMFGMQFLINFRSFIHLISLKGMAYKKDLFWSILSQWKLKHFVGNTLEENNINKNFKIGQKLHTKHQKIDQKTWTFDSFFDVWYAGFDQFWNEYFVPFSRRYYEQNYLILIDSKWIPKSMVFVRYTLEENNINKNFKIGQKLHTKHHQIDQKTWKYNRFFDVWYAVFDQFWNEYFVLCSQGYCQHNYLIFIDSKWIQKNLFFVRHTLTKNKINKSSKIDEKLHTKHHQIDQKTWKFDKFFDVWYAVFDQLNLLYFFRRGIINKII